MRPATRGRCRHRSPCKCHEAGAGRSTIACMPMPAVPPPRHGSHEAIADALGFEPLLHFQLQFRPGVCMEIRSRRRAPLYVVGSEGTWLRWGDAPAVALAAGDVVFLPHAGRHRLFNDAQAPVQPFDELVVAHRRSLGTPAGQAPSLARFVAVCPGWCGLAHPGHAREPAALWLPAQPCQASKPLPIGAHGLPAGCQSAFAGGRQHGCLRHQRIHLG